MLRRLNSMLSPLLLRLATPIACFTVRAAMLPLPTSFAPGSNEAPAQAQREVRAS
jgi:hypothetical protein